MSFVNLVMTSNFISLVSDGQITKGDEITRTHFQKFIVSPQHFVVAATGYQLIIENIKKKFYYQPNLTFDEAVKFLEQELEKYKDKQVRFGKKISYNALIAGFPNHLTKQSEPIAISFHVEKQHITRKIFKKAAIISLLPDDISFNPNQMINENLIKTDFQVPLLQIQTLQRNALYKVADQSKTVNHTIFQTLIQKDI